jgi:hypothetical protein
MVLLNPIPLNITNNINKLQTNFGLKNYKTHVYKVNFTEKILCIFEKDNSSENNKKTLIFTLLWNNECDTNPHHQINFVNFHHVKYTQSLEILQIEQVDTNNFEIKTPTSINRYIYNVNTHLFKQYVIYPGKLYEMGVNSKTEIVYYKFH